MVEGLCLPGTRTDTDRLDGKLHFQGTFLVQAWCKPGAGSDQSTAVNESRQSRWEPIICHHDSRKKIAGAAHLVQQLRLTGG